MVRLYLGLVTVTSCLMAISSPAWSADPDAGSLLREQPSAPTLQPSRPQTTIPQMPDKQPAADDSGPTVLVKGFRITGATLIPEADLQAQIQGAIGLELTLGQLQAIALQLTGYYVQQGYLARVLLPPQEISDGIVDIQVVEGKRGSINIDNQSERIDSARAKGFIDHRLAQGDAMSIVRLGEALNVLNDQPGVEATAGIKPGTGEGDIDLLITTQDKPLTNYNAGLNNTGSRSTGAAQAQGSVVFNNPFGLFDAASLLVNTSQGSRYVRGEYVVAVGETGLRMGGNASYLRYDVSQEALSALNSHGNAATVGLTVYYPLTRLQDSTLALNGSVDHKTLRDFTSAGETGDRKVSTMSLGVSGTTIDALMGGGQNGFGLTLTVGSADLSGNADALATDLATRKTDGRFAKMGFQLSRQQLLTNDWLLKASLSGQISANNLDSTQRMSLGGSGGVRAYPGGEATGDDGFLGSVELAYNVSGTLKAGPFIDIGAIRQNHSTWADWNSSNTSLGNTYSLQGGGLSANWAIADNIALNAAVAVPFGANPARDSNGNDGDGRNLSVRTWAGVTATF